MTNTDPHTGGAVDPDLEPGEVVGEYVIDGKLGQGGFGAVFRATHPLIGKVAAIKVLARRFSVDPEMVERFQAEARAVNQIRHRHIIDIFSFGTLADGRAYYAMEYLEGETLGDKLSRETRLPLETALPILRAIARALDAAHGKGIAHRDLKPDNVFLARDADGDEFPKLLDFGIAKLMRAEEGKSKTQTGIPMGTPYYMSPEQCRGRDVDHRTDYYAFGVVAYELLTGTFPLDGEDYMTILMKQIGEDPPPASTRYDGLPAGIDDALAWLMHKDPASRPPSLAAAMQALDAAGETIGIMPSRPPRSAPIDVPRASQSYASMATPSQLPLADALSPTSPAIAPALHTMAPTARPPARRGAIIGAAVGAVVIAVGVFAFVHASGGDAANAPAAAVAPAPPAPTAPVAPAAPAPAVPAVPAAPPPPIEPALVVITVTDAPDGTEIHGPGGNLLGVVPSIQLPRADQDIVLTFEAAGFKPASRTVHLSGDATVAVKLDKKPLAGVPASGHPTRPTRPHPDRQDTIEDPFAHKN